MIQQRIENPVASKILSGGFAEGDTIRIDVDAAKQVFTFAKGREAVPGELVEGKA